MEMLLTEYDPEKCTRCGICLQKCPAVEMAPKQAINAFKRLVEGDEVDELLLFCRKCFGCNYLCPQKAYPARMIHKRSQERFAKIAEEKKEEDSK